MIGIYIAASIVVVGTVLCFRSKSQVLQAVGVISAVVGGLTLAPIYLKHSKEIDNQGYLVIQEISASIENTQNEDAAKLRTLIKSNYADGKITLNEIDEISKAYNQYRAKYAVKQ